MPIEAVFLLAVITLGLIILAWIVIMHTQLSKRLERLEIMLQKMDHYQALDALAEHFKKHRNEEGRMLVQALTKVLTKPRTRRKKNAPTEPQQPARESTQE